MKHALTVFLLVSVLKSGSATAAVDFPSEVKQQACVKYVEEEHLVGFPENPPPPQGTGRYLIKVNEGYTLKQCFSAIQAQVPGTKLVSTIERLRILLVAPPKP